MRWKKRYKHRFSKIIKKYYSDKFALMIHQAMYDRSYPNCLGSLNLKTTKNMYEVKRFDLATPFINMVSVPVYLYSKVKRSRRQHILRCYVMCEIDEVNKALNRNFSVECLKNYENITEVLQMLDN